MSPKYAQQTLWVKAVKLTRHIDPTSGTPLRNMRFVGRDADHSILETGEVVAYHSFYIKEIKDGSLQAMDLQTACLAGVSFHQLVS